MSFSTLWDRFFWSFMLLVFAGIVWLWLWGDSVRYLPFGLLTGLVLGGGYLAIGVRKLRAGDVAMREAIDRAEVAAADARQTEGRDA